VSLSLITLALTLRNILLNVSSSKIKQGSSGGRKRGVV